MADLLLSNAPSLEALNRKHPEWIAQHQRWQLLKALVAGGSELNDSIKRQLLANPDHRPEKVIVERLKIASFVNKISPILTRLNSQLFEEEASYEGDPDPFWQDNFFKVGGRIEGDDDSRATFHAFQRQAMFEALTCGKAIAQVDAAIAVGKDSKASQRRLGEDVPYVVLIPRINLWDWASDEQGFRFTKIHTFRVVREDWKANPVGVHDFTIFERKDDRVLASRYLVKKKLKPNEKPPTTELEFKLDGMKPEDVEIQAIPYGDSGELLVEQEIFNVDGQYRFPIVTLTLPPMLCLADQLYDMQVAYFNSTAGIQWKLQTTNFAMPVITGGSGEGDDANIGKKSTFGDGFYLELPEGYSVSALEMGGGAVSTAMSYRKEISQDIRDILYQVALSAADGAAVVARSAASKKEDRRPEQILLGTYGSHARDFAKQILDVAAIVRGKTTEWQVIGYDDYLGEGLLEDITEFAQIEQVPVPSKEFKREKAKTFVRRFARSYDLSPEQVEVIMTELDQASFEEVDPNAPEGAGGGGSPTKTEPTGENLAKELGL